MTQAHAPGTEIIVASGGSRYRTVVGEDGVQRFVGNGAVIHLASGLGGPEGALEFAFGRMREHRHAYGSYELVAYVALLGLPVSAAASDLIHVSAKVVNPAPPEGEGVDDSLFDGPKAFRTVTVDGAAFQVRTDRDEVDVPRFVASRPVADLASTGNKGRLSPLAMHDAFRAGVFSKADYVAFQALLGIPVVALAEIPGLDECEVAWPEMPLPDPSFTAKAVAWPKGRLVPLRDAADIARGVGDAVLDDTPLVDVQFGNLFAYMYRRFGHPTVSGDDYKDLAGGWLIDSPDPGVFMTVKASLSGGWHGFVPYVLEADGDEADRGLRERTLPPGRAEEVKAAYRAMLLDLLRPVGVRDQQFNALGYVGDGDPLLDGDEDEGGDDDREQGPGFMVERHPSAGCSMPLGTFGNAQWGRLFAVASRFGDGDLVAGMGALVDVGMDRILAEVATEPSDVRVLLAAGMYGEAYDKVRERLCLSPGEDALAADVIQAVRMRRPREGFAVPEFAEADIERAGRLARWLDMRYDFLQPYRQYRFRMRVEAALDDLVARFGPELPDECEPKADRWGGISHKAVLAYPALLRERGLDGIAAWAEEVLAGEDGTAMLGQAMMVLRYWAEEHRKNSGEPEAGES